MTGMLAAHLFLVLGVGAELVCVVGVLWMRDVFDRLHYAAAGTTIGPLLIAVAVALAGLPSGAALAESLTAVLALVVLNPLLTHVTARALHRRLSVSGAPRSGSAPESGSAGP